MLKTTNMAITTRNTTTVQINWKIWRLPCLNSTKNAFERSRDKSFGRDCTLFKYTRPTAPSPFRLMITFSMSTGTTTPTRKLASVSIVVVSTVASTTTKIPTTPEWLVSKPASSWWNPSSSYTTGATAN